uniref:SWR1-complex protein 5 n=1 Tax=Rhodotorula toruloides TaxID=5286 RepID=A0A0K3CGP8_RHOTO
MAPPRSAAAQKLKKQQEDADLLPSDEEDLDFRLSDGEDDGGSGSDSDSDDEGAKRGRKRTKQEKGQSEQKEPVCVSLSSTSAWSRFQATLALIPAVVRLRVDKVAVDDLWAQFNDPSYVDPYAAPAASTSSAPPPSATAASKASPAVSKTANGKGKGKQEEELVKIVVEYEFAGEKVAQEKMVPRSSAEAQAYFARNPSASSSTSTSQPSGSASAPSDPTSSSLDALFGPDTSTSATPDAPSASASPAPVPAPSKPAPPAGGAPKRKKAGGLAGVAASLGVGKPAKLNTLEKSKLDWNSFVSTQTGLEDTLAHARKDGYLEKRDFLDRGEEEYQGARRGRWTGVRGPCWEEEAGVCCTPREAVRGGRRALTAHLLIHQRSHSREAVDLSSADSIKPDYRPTSDRPIFPGPLGTLHVALPVPPTLSSPRSHTPKTLARTSSCTSDRTQCGRGSRNAAGAGLQLPTGTALTYSDYSTNSRAAGTLLEVPRAELAARLECPHSTSLSLRPPSQAVGHGLCPGEQRSLPDNASRCPLPRAAAEGGAAASVDRAGSSPPSLKASMSSHNDDIVMQVIKQESVEPVEVTFADEEQVKTESVDEGRRSMAPSPEPGQAVAVVNSEHRLVSTLHSVVSRRRELRPLLRIVAEGVHGGSGATDASLGSLLMQVEQELLRATVGVQYWRAVSEKAGEKVEEERAKFVAFVCLVKVLAAQREKHMGESVAAQKNVEHLEKQKKDQFFEVAVIQEVLARHHVAFHGSYGFPILHSEESIDTSELAGLGATSNGICTVQPGQVALRQPQCVRMDTYRSRLVEAKNKVVATTVAYLDAVKGRDQAGEHLMVHAKNKNILSRTAPHVKQSREKAEEEYKMAKKHLANMIRFKEEQLKKANTLRNSMRPANGHYTTTFVRVHL